jgi:hypothetical protein
VAAMRAALEHVVMGNEILRTQYADFAAWERETLRPDGRATARRSTGGGGHSNRGALP